MKIKRMRGFSLVELLVVITVIIVISAITMVNYGGSSKKARDARRIADLEKIRLALEMARQVGNTYPLNASSALVPTYLQTWPTDPKTGSYTYTRDALSNYKYTLDATMEDLGSTNMPGNIYRVTNL